MPSARSDLRASPILPSSWFSIAARIAAKASILFTDSSLTRTLSAIRSFFLRRVPLKDLAELRKSSAIRAQFERCAT